MTTHPLKSLPDLARRPLPEAVARTLRHEIGDFLQKVYAIVAILHNRLPAEMTYEHDLLDQLRQRGEVCRQMLDAVQDFIAPSTLECEPVDFAELAERLVRGARARHPKLEVRTQAAGPAAVVADPAKAALVGEALLANACQAARGSILFETAVSTSDLGVDWTITDDGPGAAPAVAERLFEPFFTTRAGHAGLGLSLAKKLVMLHGGRIGAENIAAGGFRATAHFPAQPSPRTKEDPAPPADRC